MKPFWLFILLALSLWTCQSDKAVSPGDYDGEYPYFQSTGKPIGTNTPKIISGWSLPPVTSMATPVVAAGQYTFMFKDHDWNHWPYIVVGLLKYTKTPSSYEYISHSVLGIRFAALSGFQCEQETINVGIPAQVGRYNFSQNINYSYTNPSFYTKDCDAPKDLIVADSSATNWVNITRLDTLTKQVEGSFDLSFKITRKDVTYSIVYPTHIRMRGSFNGPFTTR